MTTKMVSDLEDLIYQERLKEIRLTTLKEKGDNYNIQIDEQPGGSRQKSCNNEKKRRGQIFEGTKKKVSCFNDAKKQLQLSLEKYR